jgi:O-methyltransferase domain
VVDGVAGGRGDAHQELLASLRGYVTTQIAGALAELGVAEALTDDPAPTEALADALDLPPDALHRLLRAAATAGLVDEPVPGRFRANARSELLRPGVVGSLHHFARNVTGEAHWSVWGRLADAVRTGSAQAEPALGMSMWEHYGAHPDEEQEFAAAMSERTATQTAAIVATAGLVDARRIVDVGGSQGALLRAYLAARPSATGVLFDRADVVAGLAPDLCDPALAGRLEIVGGDFFVEVPSGGDAYLLKLVLHDWPDVDAAKILRAVRAAIDPAGVLAVIELVVPPDGARSPAHLLDLSMLVSFGGRERTREEFRALLADAGFKLDEVLPLAADVDRAVLLATPV